MNSYEQLEDYFDFEGDDEQGSYEDEFEAYLGDDGEWEAGGDFESWESSSSDDEGHGSYNGDPEGDLFLGSAIKGLVPKKLKVMAQNAAQAAGAAIGQKIGGRRGRHLGRLAGQLAGRYIQEAEYSGEYESEFEGDWEAQVGDYELVEEMSYLAEQAVRANTDEEADEFIGALAGLAAPLVAQAAPAIISAAPGLINTGIKAIGNLFRRRRRRRKSREFEAEDAVIQALPEIAGKTATSLAKQLNAGHQVTPERIAATIAKKTTEVVANPRMLVRAVKSTQDKARQMKQQGGPQKYARRCPSCGKVTVRAKRLQRP